MSTIVNLKARVEHLFKQSMETKAQCLPMMADPITDAASLIVNSLLGGGKVLGCGNGASAAHAQHFASLMLNRFERERPGLPAIALTTDSAIVTSIANDHAYKEVFGKQVNALGHPGDVLLAITSSGNSENLIKAVRTAEERQMKVVAITGKDGGVLSTTLGPDDIEIRCNSESNSRIQEVHLLVIHCLCDLIDVQLLGA